MPLRRRTSRRASSGSARPWASWSERRSALAALATLPLLACAGPTLSSVGAAAPSPAALPCAEVGPGADPEALGFALAWLDPAVPRDLDALAAWVEQTGPLSAVAVE